MSLFGSIRALTVLLTDTSKTEWHFKGVLPERLQQLRVVDRLPLSIVLCSCN
jgi:hypothetical protein